MEYPIVNLSVCLEKLESGGRPKGGASLDSNGVLSIGAEHLNNNGEFKLSNPKFIPSSYFKKMRQGIIEDEDILIVKDGATTGKTIFVYSTKPFAEAAVNEHVFLVRTNKRILLPKYAFYILYSSVGKQQILSDFRGAAQGGISRSFANQVKLALPPVSEQRRIVEILDQADEIRKLRKQADEIAEKIIPALFYEMFGDLLSNPKNWNQMTLGETGSKVRYGLGQPPKLSTDGIPMLRATNISRGTITTKDLIYVIEEAVPKSKNAFLATDEVLVVRSGAYTGDVAQVTKEWEGAIAGYDLVITPSNKLIGEFVESYLLTDYVQNYYFKNLKVRGGQPHLNAEQLLATPFYVPPIATQEKYSFYLNELRANRKSVELAKDKLENLFSKLLSDGFTGELTKSWREAHMKKLLKEMEEQKKYLEKVN